MITRDEQEVGQIRVYEMRMAELEDKAKELEGLKELVRWAADVLSNQQCLLEGQDFYGRCTKFPELFAATLLAENAIEVLTQVSRSNP